MTEQEKAALVSHCEFMISEHIKYGGYSDDEQIYRIALAALTTPPTPAIPDGWRVVKVEADEVLVALKRIEGYEDCDAQILAEDAMARPDLWPEWRVVETVPKPGGDAS